MEQQCRPILGDQTINKGFSQSHPLVVSTSWKKKEKDTEKNKTVTCNAIKNKTAKGCKS